MNFDDIIYVSLLVLCIGFGKYYRTIKDNGQSKLIGTAFGLLIILIVSGWHILHPLISGSICALIILFVDKRKCHIVSFIFMFGYLFFFRMTEYFGIPLPPGHTNMIQMVLTLKLVGLAFEVNTAFTNGKDDDKSLLDTWQQNKEQEMFVNINFADIFHYGFNYIGLLTGPYFRYRTFMDYFQLPFRQHAKCDEATLKKFLAVPIFAVAYLVVSHFWPLSYATTTEFYEDRSVFYRLMYVWPTFFIFRMRIYIGITLSECVCTMAGFGAYPIQSAAVSGGGPKNEYNIYSETANQLEYDFQTIKNIDAYNTDTCITFREAMKHWNICVQYWLAINVYKRFPSKAYRTAATLLVSAVWHGVYPGYYFCILGAPFYLPIEDIYQKLWLKNESIIGVQRKIVETIAWISKFFAFSYMGIAFLLMTMDKIWFYYSSVYHLGYIYFAFAFIIGRVLLSKQKKSRSNLTTATNSVPSQQQQQQQQQPKPVTADAGKKLE